MACITQFPSGYKAVVGGNIGNLDPEKRGEVSGWSAASARRNDQFLRSIDIFKLAEYLDPSLPEPDGGSDLVPRAVGYSLSLTMQTCPASFKDFEKKLRLFMDWVRKQPGFMFGHFLTEWQPRSRTAGGPCPHVHCVIFFEYAKPPEFIRGPGLGDRYVAEGALIFRWLHYFKDFGANYLGQHAVQVYSVSGWLQYLGKHGSRSATNYQRSFKSMPWGWHKTGQMWKKWGAWPVSETAYNMSNAAFFAFRRLANRYQIADARAALFRRPLFRRSNLKRLSYLKRRLIAPADKACFIPVSDWAPGQIVTAFLARCCVDIGHNPETGEIGLYYVLPHEA